MASLTRQVAHNLIYQIVGKTISTILGLIALGIITRYLNQSGFGAYTTIISFLQFFGILVDFGLVLITVQMISEPQANVNKVINNIFTLRFFSALVFLGLAPIVVLFFPYDISIKIGVAITTLSFFFIALNQILIGLFQKNLRMDKVVIAENFGRLVLIAATLLFIHLQSGLLGIMTAVILGSFTNFLLNFIFSLSYVRIKFDFDFALWKEIFHRSWPIGLSIIFNLIYLRADTIILSIYKSQAEVGLYGASYRVIDVLTTFPMMFVGLLLPVLTATWAEKNLERFKRVIQKAFDFLVMLAVPLIFGAFLLGERIMAFIAGPAFATSGTILKVLILAVGAIFVGTLFGHIIVAIQKQKVMIWAYAAVAFLSLLGYLTFIPRYSFWGAAWITVFSESAITFLSFLVTYRSTKFFPSPKILIKAFIGSFLMFAILYLFKNLNLAILILMGAIIYFVILYFLKGYTKETILEIIKLKSE